MALVRVAALQFAAGIDVESNRKKVLGMIDKAAAHKPDLIVMPEFANHASWYQSQEHCYEVAVGLDSLFVTSVADKAKEIGGYIVLNVTLKREHGKTTGSSILFDRTGQVLAVSDKQVLMGHENDFLQKAQQVSPVVETEIGRLGLYSCMDGVIAETPRSLAVRGAQILCNSLNSFAVDEASLHVPVRAAENKLFLVAANKVGPLIPEDQLDFVSQVTQIPRHFLFGAGESQIVAPDGTVLAKASLANEEVIIADIDPRQANHKLRPDGNSIFENRRPELYRALWNKPSPISYSTQSKDLRVACWQGKSTDEQAIADLCKALPDLSRNFDLLVLPELFFMPDLSPMDWSKALSLSTRALDEIERATAHLDIQIAGSFLLEGKKNLQHCGVLVSNQGILMKQAQLHFSARYGHEIELGQHLNIMELSYGKVGIIVGEDAIYPEVFRLMALEGVDLVVIPGHLQEHWEIATGLVERAAENRMCLAFASRPQPIGASLMADLEGDFTLMTEWKERSFDGRINMPRINLASRFPGILGATLHLGRAHNKVISSRTHLLDDRPWHLPDAGYALNAPS